MKQVNATHVYAEEEVEYELRELMEFTNDSLKVLAFAKEGPKFVLWRTPFYDVEVIHDCDCFVIVPLFGWLCWCFIRCVLLCDGTVQSLMDIPASYDDLNKLQVGVSFPLPLTALPGAHMEIEWG